MISIEQLQFYLAQGYKLLPCSKNDKKPLTSHGFKDASNDVSLITSWHKQYPDCAWGTPTSSDYAVVDVDPKNDGDITWKELLENHGPIPDTPYVETGSGGFHYIFRFPTGTRCGILGKGIDLKADGGYVIIPPSRISEPHHFQPYKWITRPWDIPIAVVPEWLTKSDKSKSEKVKADTIIHQTLTICKVIRVRLKVIDVIPFCN